MKQRQEMTKQDAAREAVRRWGKDGFAQMRGVLYFVGSGVSDWHFGESTTSWAEAFKNYDNKIN